jgi:hypothetical protein
MSEVSLANEPLVREQPLPLPPLVLPQRGLGAAQWGMISFLVSETSLFTLIAWSIWLCQSGSERSDTGGSVTILVSGTTICAYWRGDRSPRHEIRWARR